MIKDPVYLEAVPLKNVKLNYGLFYIKNEVVRKEVIPYQWKALNNEIADADPSNAIENFRIAAGETGGEFVGMVFQDSDVAKWLEAVAYQLTTNPDEELEKLADSVIDLIEKAQQPDGYLNTYYTIKEPDHKWTNLAECHELYCAGHMIEAAVAYYQASKKRKLLDVVIRFADLIAKKFGREEDKIKGYPGHQEIEMALIKLYKTTGNKKYRELAKYFIDERGKEPNYFDLEWEKRGKTSHWPDQEEIVDLAYFQAHKPVREQATAVGHAVRAMYMYCGMADVAKETGDKQLLEACKRLWNNVTKKQMYITGGIGSSGHLESFTFDYDLPNDTAYTETCAAIALIFFAQRMFHLDPKAEYIDIMERALYNGVLSGISEDGQKFFYVNPLEVRPGVCQQRHDHKHVKPVRQKWFGCACCPPNLARLLASIGQYIYSYNQDSVFVNLYIDSTVDLELNNNEMSLKQETNYPWDGNVKLTILKAKKPHFVLALRIPSWCKQAKLKVNGEKINIAELIDNGYVYLNSSWTARDTVELSLNMPVERVSANPQVRENIGKVAIQRGPVVYCLEEVDNGSNLPAIYLPDSTELKAAYRSDLLGGVTMIRGQAVKLDESAWSGRLYSTENLRYKPIEITAVPYFSWNNRQAGEMLVWINKMN
ncbi:beta-L-arabinofuranosidase domain-containing protein [Halocella sp. SP3-1]|uniref:glycoside hydrolase family 127 protein n=1 Tax=Halocella sp. SP3-1 TaxID=2382161 RepID=UPI000F74E177|nr:beta-L-arabinofuranosidase domain-containing protein [Halocella sp. SP3-1]AZO96465.1 glycoside hydrolase family 127 protein [Halocella sp. SP3-1]